MDIYILISVLSVMHSWILFTALSAPLEETPTASTDPQQRPHVRTKRCSCATFMDNECVYFCHLDIIWVNTPERVVSYGLGNAPRKRRAAAAAAADSMATGSGPRCQCLRQNDAACKNFCRLENNLRHETSTDSAEGKHKPSADTSRIQRMWSRIRATLKTRLLLKKWRVRQRQRARSWDGESTAS